MASAAESSSQEAATAASTLAVPGIPAAEACTDGWYKVGPATAFARHGARLHSQVAERFVTTLRAPKGGFACIDSVCYHMGGPLGVGDIEDVNGWDCIVCPWHHYPIKLEDGSKPYQAMEMKDGKLQPGGWKATASRQRVHEAEERADGNVYVRLSDTSASKYGSDTYAFNAGGAKNLVLRTEAGADGKRKPQLQVELGNAEGQPLPKRSGHIFRNLLPFRK